MKLTVALVLLASLCSGADFVLYSTNTASPYCYVPQTGQTNSYLANDDGAYQKGSVPPTPRFTAGSGTSSNCVTDNLTGLMWFRAPQTNSVDWTNAVAYAENLDGDAGRGGYTDWRLPNVREYLSLCDYKKESPSLPTGHPFFNIRNVTYWTSTTRIGNVNAAWNFSFSSSGTTYDTKSTLYPAMAVRGP